MNTLKGPPPPASLKNPVWQNSKNQIEKEKEIITLNLVTSRNLMSIIKGDESDTS